jgi:uncharacterized membrane protein YphA (DoxX/SURF4 family)
LHPAGLWAALTILVEIIGPLLILAGRLVWLGAGMLGVFTVAAMVANAFWTLPAGAAGSWRPTPSSSTSGWRAASCWWRWWRDRRGDMAR